MRTLEVLMDIYKRCPDCGGTLEAHGRTDAYTYKHTLFTVEMDALHLNLDTASCQHEE